MIEQQGQVVALDGEAAWVRVGGQTGCPACDAGRGCGAGLFGRLLRRRDVRLKVPNSVRARPGQAVTLGLRESDFLSLVLRLYGAPLVAGLAGAALGHALAATAPLPAAWLVDAATGIGGFVAGGLALQLSRRGLAERFARLSPALVQPAAGLECASSDRTQ